jgi:hypothetical protein
MELAYLTPVKELLDTMLGGLISCVNTWIAARSQGKHAQRSHERQERKESHQHLQETRKETQELLWKIRTETTLLTSHIIRKTGVTSSQEHYQKCNDTVHKLQAIINVHFPQIQYPVTQLAELTTRFWKQHETVVFLEGVDDPTRFNDDRGYALKEISNISEEVNHHVTVAASLLSSMS